MKPATRAVVLAGTAVFLGAAVAVRIGTRDAAPAQAAVTAGAADTVQAPATALAGSTVQVEAAPEGTLLEFGSTRCSGCKAMHAELGLLHEECAKGPKIREIDVFTDEELPERYRVAVIPTQV